MQQQMELAAASAIAATNPGKGHRQAACATTAAQRGRRPLPRTASPKHVFTNERFKAYELTYSGGATLVSPGETLDHAGKVKYVTLIAQPDFNGVPKCCSSR